MQKVILSSLLALTATVACAEFERSNSCKYEQPPKSSYLPDTISLRGEAADQYQTVSRSLKLDDDGAFHVLVRNPEVVEQLRPPEMLLYALEKPTAGFLAFWRKRWNANPYCFKPGCGAEGKMELDIAKRGPLRKLRKNFDDPNRFILTHIARIGAAGESICFPFNAYHSEFGCFASTQSKHEDVASIIRSGLAAVKQSAATLEQMAQKLQPTHVLVMSTGWNTTQGQSLYNYGEWVRAISAAAHDENIEFRPLVIGFAWQSTWDDLPGGKAFSVVNKGNDADEVGAGWINLVVQQVIMPTAEAMGVPVILIGHSYGTRALGQSVFRAELVKQTPTKSPDAFIAFSAALPLRRLLKDGGEPYWTEDVQTGVLLTASQHDTANGLRAVRKFAYAGGRYGLLLAEKDEDLKKRIVVRTGDINGTINPPVARGEIVLADLSATVNCVKPGTGGGAHSDVFDREAGNLILQVIKQMGQKRTQ